MKRRTFIKRSVAASATIGFPTIIPSTVLGKDGNVAPNDKVAVALIACGSRSRYADVYQHYNKSVIAAVCDPIKSRRLAHKKRYGNCPDFNDFRDVLARKDIDAVHISTADHWHVPIAMLAAKAGKDMYTEKPLGISIAQDLESRAIVDTHKRIFQYGAQQRSLKHVRLGIELVLNGHIGEVKDIYVWCDHGQAGGDPTSIPVPTGFDYNLWLGPAPEVPFSRDRCLALKHHHRNGIFHIYDYAIGFMAGWGAHPMDMMQWWADNAGFKTIPSRFEGTGTLPTKGLYNTITHWDATCTFDKGPTIHFMDNTTAHKKKPHPGIVKGHGTLFVGTNGWVRTSREGWSTSTVELRRKAKDPGAKRLPISKDQIQNFVDCVISREQPVDDLHSAVRSDIACHLTDICIREGRPITWDPTKETIVGDDLAAKRMQRPARNWNTAG